MTTRFAKLRREVEDALQEEFEKLPIYLGDRDGETHRMVVYDVSLGSESVISLSEHYADFLCQAEFSFEADIEYLDPNSGFHDSDTRSTIYLGSIETTIRRAVELPAEVSIAFDPTDIDRNAVTDVSVNSNDPVWIYVDEEDIW